MLTWEDILYTFADTLAAHIGLAALLFAILDERDWRQLKKLPLLVLSPLLATVLSAALYDIPALLGGQYFLISFAILVMCTLWTRWAWQINLWRAFAATCMAGIFQVADATLSFWLPDEETQFALAICLHLSINIAAVLLLYRLRFGKWFRLLLEGETAPWRTALLLFALEASTEVFLRLGSGVRPQYLPLYYLLVAVTVLLMAGLVVYLGQRFDAARRLEAQRDIIAQQQLYEQDLESIRREVRAFRHDYKNLLAGLSQQADEGELEQLRAALSQLDAGFDRSIGEKIRTSTQIGNLRIPQVRSLLLSKLASMGAKGIDCRMEVLYPVERVAMDLWDFTRCLGILLDNAAEAAAETETPWVEIVLLSQGERLSLRVSNPYAGTVEGDKIWTEGFSTKGEGRGLGLSSYQRLLAGYANVTASTSWANGIFVQELTVEGRP